MQKFCASIYRNLLNMICVWLCAFYPVGNYTYLVLLPASHGSHGKRKQNSLRVSHLLSMLVWCLHFLPPPFFFGGGGLFFVICFLFATISFFSLSLGLGLCLWGVYTFIRCVYFQNFSFSSLGEKHWGEFCFRLKKEQWLTTSNFGKALKTVLPCLLNLTENLDYHFRASSRSYRWIDPLHQN